MSRLLLALLLVTLIPSVTAATTSQDIRSRIKVDGDVTDFDADEWILDSSTPFPEMTGDSQWGDDNDIRAVAATWDLFNIYIAVPAVTISSTLMLFLDVGCGGVDELSDAGSFRRNIEFSLQSPNVMLRARGISDPPELAMTDCDNPFDVIDSDEYQGVFVQTGAVGGALEVAIPWGLIAGFEAVPGGMAVPEAGRTLRVLAVISGGLGTGAGDAAPDPSMVLENDSTRLAILNNHVRLPLDGDGDGLLDMGVSPRSIASYAVMKESVRQVLPLEIVVPDKLVEPGQGTHLEFFVSLDPPEYQQPVYVTGRIYSSDGRLLRSLFDDEPLVLAAGPVMRSWDGRDDRGKIVPGGVYVLAVSAGLGRDASKKTVTASFAVIR